MLATPLRVPVRVRPAGSGVLWNCFFRRKAGGDLLSVLPQALNSAGVAQSQLPQTPLQGAALLKLLNHLPALGLIALVSSQSPLHVLTLYLCMGAGDALPETAQAFVQPRCAQESASRRCCNLPRALRSCRWRASFAARRRPQSFTSLPFAVCRARTLRSRAARESEIAQQSSILALRSWASWPMGLACCHSAKATLRVTGSLGKERPPVLGAAAAWPIGGLAPTYLRLKGVLCS